MNKPKFESRGKIRKQGVKPEDELREALSDASLNSPAAQSQETAMASQETALASAETALASQETALTTTPEREFVITHPVSMEDPAGTPLQDGLVSMDVSFAGIAQYGHTVIEEANLESPALTAKVAEGEPYFFFISWEEIQKKLAEEAQNGVKVSMGMEELLQYRVQPTVTTASLDLSPEAIAALHDNFREVEGYPVGEHAIVTRAAEGDLFPSTSRQLRDAGIPEDWVDQRPRLRVFVTRPLANPQLDMGMIEELLTKQFKQITGLTDGAKIDYGSIQGKTTYKLATSYNELRMSFIEAPLRKRAKMFEQWMRAIETNGITKSTTVELAIVAIEGSDVCNPDQISDVWLLESVYPNVVSGGEVWENRQEPYGIDMKEFTTEFASKIVRISKEIPPNILELVKQPV